MSFGEVEPGQPFSGLGTMICRSLCSFLAAQLPVSRPRKCLPGISDRRPRKEGRWRGGLPHAHGPARVFRSLSSVYLIKSTPNTIGFHSSKFDDVDRRRAQSINKGGKGLPKTSPSRSWLGSPQFTSPSRGSSFQLGDEERASLSRALPALSHDHPPKQPRSAWVLTDGFSIRSPSAPSSSCTFPRRPAGETQREQWAVIFLRVCVHD